MIFRQSTQNKEEANKKGKLMFAFFQKMEVTDMTLQGAINTIDDLKPNTYTVADKVRWLSELDGKIKIEIIDTHEGGESITFEPYTEDNLTVELLVPAPYDDIYIKYLESQIDYSNGEIGKYNNSTATFNAKMSDFERQYNRANAPKAMRARYF